MNDIQSQQMVVGMRLSNAAAADIRFAATAAVESLTMGGAVFATTGSHVHTPVHAATVGHARG